MTPEHNPQPPGEHNRDRECQAPKSGRLEDTRYVAIAAELYYRHCVNDDARTQLVAADSEAWHEFDELYAGSYVDGDAFIEDIIGDLGWYETLRIATHLGGIPSKALALDYEEIFDYLIRYFHVIPDSRLTPEDHEVVLHAFRKPGIAPPAAEAIGRRRNAHA